jgi:hypothetical protein
VHFGRCGCDPFRLWLTIGKQNFPTVLARGQDVPSYQYYCGVSRRRLSRFVLPLPGFPAVTIHFFLEAWFQGVPSPDQK